ncbi:alkaline phosphatase [Aliidiomarina minuta]|uniref:Alkaline phosphatase n=1 Tax=Aliidiomarina minuta TaxID=880057 RepID=A0A432W3Y2_9GAMM|nr:alkaline phosphatase D family protein [Aliidiomarina minuta]RUO24075.1 alkaline phosphatase [Aliidiomarina minuta]
MTHFSRRDFLKVSTSAMCAVAVSASLTTRSMAADMPVTDVSFEHGVASGDPQTDAVILWTRAEPENDVAAVTIEWQLASDSEFKNIVRYGNITTFKHRDYTVKIDVQRLQPGQRYYYRFKGKNQYSPAGVASTLPQGSLTSLKMAVFSCSNYPAGYFNAYSEAAKDPDLDIVVHLGDYIYEYGAGGYATEKSKEIGRAFAADNQGELLTLNDYRKRYALYRSDKGLQAMHAAAPCIAVWDDHEIANDTWKSGAENHDPSKGDFYQRRAAAVQAYYEWMPIRPPQGEQSAHIYRSFDFGDLFSLHMLDARIIKRARQLEYADYLDAETQQLDMPRFMQDWHSDRDMLGRDQLHWLGEKLRNSNSRWQILGQQVLMSRMHLPAELLGNSDLTKAPKLLENLLPLKRRQLAGEALEPAERARLEQQMPYNLDAWDGYPTARESLYQAADEAGKSLVVLSGDTHNAWHNNLLNAQGKQVGVEFATSSVSSPGIEHYLQLDDERAPSVAEAFTLLIDDLQYCNLHQRGFMNLTITHQDMEVEWVFIDNILSEDYEVVGRHKVTHRA